MGRQNPNWVVTGKDRDDAYAGALFSVVLIALGVIGLAAWGFAWWLGVGMIVFGAICLYGATGRLKNVV